MPIQRIKLKDLVATVKGQARAELNADALADYTEHAKAAKAKGADPQFPPLVGFKSPFDETGKVYLSSGFTRRQALLKAGFEEYDVDVRDSEDPKRDALKFGFTANREHGARLTNADKKHNLLLALEDPEWAELSGNALAELVGVSESFVRNNKPAAKKKTTVKNKKGGTTNTANIGKKGGSERKKKAEAKKGKGNKGADAPDKPDDKPQTDTALDTAKAKIAKAIDGHHGFTADGFVTAVTDGSLPLSAPEIKKMAATSDDRIRLLAPLVLNSRWSVAKAISFIDKVPDEKTNAETFINLAISHGGLLRERVGDFACIWLRSDDYTVGEKDGVVTITPKGGKRRK